MALIFDLDGVIVDSNPIHTEVWALYMRSCGIEPDDTMPRRMYGRRNDEIVRDLFGGHLTPAEIATHGAAKEALFRRMIGGDLGRHLVPGVGAFLQRYSRVPMGLASNAEPENVRFVLDNSGLRSYFGVVVNGHDVEKPKPAPEIYLRTAELLGALPRNCVVFEDSISGVEAARAAGARVVAVTTTCAELPGVSLKIDDFLSVELDAWLKRQVPLR